MIGMTNEEAKTLEEIVHDLEDKYVSTIRKLEEENEFLRKRESKLQTIEQMYKSGIVDLSELNKIVNEIKKD